MHVCAAIMSVNVTGRHPAKKHASFSMLAPRHVLNCGALLVPVVLAGCPSHRCPSVQMAEAPPLMPGQLGPPNMLQPNTQSSPVQYGSQKKPKPDKIHGWKLMMQKKIKFKNLKF